MSHPHLPITGIRLRSGKARLSIVWARRYPLSAFVQWNILAEIIPLQGCEQSFVERSIGRILGRGCAL
jgi:hypothetical protein